MTAQHSPESIPPKSDDDTASEPAVSRRGFLGKLGGWVAGIKLIRDLIAGLTGAAAASAGAYVIVDKKIGDLRKELSLESSDFTISQDETRIDLSTNSIYLDVKVNRRFTQIAKKQGRYNYECFCLGQWEAEKCSIHWESADGKASKSIEVSANQDHEGKAARGARETSVVGRIQGKVPIDIEKGDKVKLDLLSTESVKFARFFYLLSLSSDIDRSHVSWAWPNSPSGVEPRCWIYNEREALRRVNQGIQAELRDYHEGVDILIKWGEETA